MRCLNTWEDTDGNSYNLLQVNSYSFIPQSIIDANTPMYVKVYEPANTLPPYVTNTGDLVTHISSSTYNKVVFAESELFSAITGYYYYQIGQYEWWRGTHFLCPAASSELGGIAWVDIKQVVMDNYFGVIIDDENQRGYFVWLAQLYNHVWAGYNVYVVGGKYNGVDIIYNTFVAYNRVATGGGATHIAKVTGELKNLSNNLSDILIIAGGGGGGLISNETVYNGKNAGGISGSGNNSANQSTGYAFGQGESKGGGSGLYGGYKAGSSNSGGAGSGYIGNALLDAKKMVGYNVPTSSAEGTKTESVNTYSATPTADTPKAGNGFAKISFIQ